MPYSSLRQGTQLCVDNWYSLLHQCLRCVLALPGAVSTDAEAEPHTGTMQSCSFSKLDHLFLSCTIIVNPDSGLTIELCLPAEPC